MEKSREKLIPLGKYRHYKGKEYEVVGLARHSETLEEMVVYKALYTSPDFGKDALWVRPAKMFMGKILVNGQITPRFQYLDPK